MRFVTLTFVDNEENLVESSGEVLSDEELAQRAASSLAEILAQEKNPLDYLEWKVEVSK